MKRWLYETYWSLRVLNAYLNIETAYKRGNDPKLAKRAYINALHRLGKYDFAIAELAHYTARQFEMENSE